MNGKLTATLSARGRLKATLSKAIERIEPIIKPLEITENGEYTAPENVHGFNPVKVDVPIRYEEGYQDGYKAMQDGLQEKEITANGEYTADEGHTGFKKVKVNVSMDNPGKPYIDTSKMTRFYQFFYDDENLEVLAALDTSNGTNFEGMFAACDFTEIPQIDTGKGVRFTSMFNGCSKLLSIPPLDTSNGTDFRSMFSNCQRLQAIPPLDTSNGTDFSSMFADCYALHEVTKLDTGKGTSLYGLFDGCRALKEVPPLDINKGTSFASMFAGCSALEKVTFTTIPSADFTATSFEGCENLKELTIPEGWNRSLYLQDCPNLTFDCLYNILINLADLTFASAKTLRVGGENLQKLVEEYGEDVYLFLEEKNWNYS